GAFGGELRPDQRRVEWLPGVVVEVRVGGAAGGGEEIERATHEVGGGLARRAPVGAGLAVQPAPPVLELPPLSLEEPQQVAARARAAAAVRVVAALSLRPAVIGHASTWSPGVGPARLGWRTSQTTRISPLTPPNRKATDDLPPHSSRLSTRLLPLT